MSKSEMRHPVHILVTKNIFWMKMELFRTDHFCFSKWNYIKSSTIRVEIINLEDI